MHIEALHNLIHISFLRYMKGIICTVSSSFNAQTLFYCSEILHFEALAELFLDMQKLRTVISSDKKFSNIEDYHYKDVNSAKNAM